MGRSILVVEDHLDTREALAEFLADLGCSVTVASTGVTALELVRRGLRPSLVLLDLMMPGFDGLDFLRARDGLPALRDVPVVVVTGRSEDRPPGARLVLRKPISLAQLEEVVELFCPAG